MRLVAWFAVLVAMLAGPAVAQHYPAPHAELPSAEQPERRVPTTGYTLALSWAPEYCHSRRGARAGDDECAGAHATGFTLHGLWPDGDGPNRWPQYCHPVAILTDAQIAAGIDATPSAQLLQHEWAKHGSCTGDDPVRYFAEEDRLYRGIHLPDMAALATRRDVTAGEVAGAFADANPGLRPTMLRVTANRNGWLEEVWLCLGANKRPVPCAASGGGAPSGQRIRIERPGGGYAGRGYAGQSYGRPSYGSRAHPGRNY